MSRNIHLTYVDDDNRTREVHFTTILAAIMWAASWGITYYTIERA